jgi:hypothetical protein
MTVVHCSYVELNYHRIKLAFKSIQKENRQFVVIAYDSFGKNIHCNVYKLGGYGTPEMLAVSYSAAVSSDGSGR